MAIAPLRRQQFSFVFFFSRGKGGPPLTRQAERHGPPSEKHFRGQLKLFVFIYSIYRSGTQGDTPVLPQTLCAIVPTYLDFIFKVMSDFFI